MNKPIRIRQFFKSLKIYFGDGKTLSGLNNNIKPKTLLVVKLDAIGDYLLFRNFLEDIRKNKKFSEHKITLCGNIIWKELAEDFDKLNVDEFIWIDKKKFTSERSYRDAILKEINSNGFEVAFQPTFSRDLITGDSIIRATNAKEKIGSSGDDANENLFLKKIGDGFYTKLLSKNSEIDFEFKKNKIIVEEFIEGKTLRLKPEIYFEKKSPEKPYALLFPGAGEKQKQWNEKGFAAVAEKLFSEFKFDIKLCGSTADSFFAEEIISNTIFAKPENLCGKTNLHELIDEIANADFLFTNDSSALHIAACVNTKTVCVLNGRHFGRFAPYPNSISPNLHFIFSDKMDELISENFDEAVAMTKYRSVDSIDSISIEKVLKEIDKILK